MIIVLNGYPGTGKLTIGRALADRMKGRLLDIHSVYNIAFALTEFRSPEFREAVERVEAIAHDLILKRPPDEPIILTTVLTAVLTAVSAGDNAWGRAEWARMQTLGARRPPFCVVHVHCALDENIRRITSPGRQASRKPVDAQMARRNHAGARPLMGDDATHLLRLDTTELGADAAAQAIAAWALDRPAGA